MFIALDLETTGFDPSEDNIIEFGAIKFDLNGQTETLQFLVNPGFGIPQIITHITNIKNSDLKSAKTFSEHIDEIKNFLENLPIIGHNIKFDLGFLKNNGLEINNEEYDTQELASILLPNMPSYSLEILTHKLGLPHEEKHRALNDATASMELFIYLLKEIQDLKPELLKKIQNLCQKTNWPLKKVFLTINNLKISDKIKRITPNIIKTHTKKQNPTENHLTEETVRKIINQNNPTLFEYNHSYENLIKNLINQASPDTYISIPYKIFNAISNEITDSIAKIDTQRNYLSPTRLEKFSSQNHFKNYEITSLLKYLIFSQKTSNGLINEVNLFNQEKITINKINIDENSNNLTEEYFFQKALEKDKNAPTLCTHQYIIENYLQKTNQNSIPENSKLIIIDLENFTNQLHKIISTYLKLDPLTEILNNLANFQPDNHNIQNLINKSVILFGLIGIIFEKDYQEDDFVRRASVNSKTITSKEWQEAKATISNLIETSGKLVEIKDENTKSYLGQWKNKLKELHHLFFTPEPDNNLIWIEQDRQENIVIRKMPYSIKKELNELLSKYKNFTIIDENLSFSGGTKFIENLYGLPEKLPIIDTTQSIKNLSILLCNDINDSDKNQIPNFLTRYHQDKNEIIAIIFTSKKILQLFTLLLTEKNLPTISQLSGSVGKLQEQFLQSLNSGEKPILLITPNTWEYFEYTDKIDTIFIHKLPFIPPSSPELMTISQNYQNPFIELQIPLATFTLKKLITKLVKNSEKPKKAIILDSRIVTKDYSKEIIKNLNNLNTPEFTSLDML